MTKIRIVTLIAGLIAVVVGCVALMNFSTEEELRKINPRRAYTFVAPEKPSVFEKAVKIVKQEEGTYNEQLGLGMVLAGVIFLLLPFLKLPDPTHAYSDALLIAAGFILLATKNYPSVMAFLAWIALMCWFAKMLYNMNLPVDKDLDPIGYLSLSTVIMAGVTFIMLLLALK